VNYEVRHHASGSGGMLKKGKNAKRTAIVTKRALNGQTTQKKGTGLGRGEGIYQPQLSEEDCPGSKSGRSWGTKWGCVAAD